MAEDRYYLSGSDRSAIAEALAKLRNVPAVPLLRSHHQEDGGSSPDVYIARTPANGIPALVGEFTPGTGTGSCEPGWAGTGTGTGTGIWATDDDQPGHTECQVYRIVEVCGVPVLDHVAGLTRRVYNLSATAIPGDTWIRAVRDKWGSWLADMPPASSTPAPHLAAGGRLNSSSDPVYAGVAGSILYYTPYIHDRIAIWDTSTSAFVERSIHSAGLDPAHSNLPYFDLEDLVSPGTGTHDDDFNYDAYAYWDGSQVRMECRKWTAAQTNAYVSQHNPLVGPGLGYSYYNVRIKTGDPSRRYLGSGRYEPAVGLIQDRQRSKCFLWNNENRIQTPIYVFCGHSSNYDYTTLAYVPWNSGGGVASASGKFEWMFPGFSFATTFTETTIDVVASMAVSNTSIGTAVRFAIGFNSGSSPGEQQPGTASQVVNQNLGAANAVAKVIAHLAVGGEVLEHAPGYNYLVPLIQSDEIGTTSWQRATGLMTGTAWF